MKYLKKFETGAEYTAFKNSEDFITPNVTYVVSNNIVYMTSDDYTIFEVVDGEFEVTDGTFEIIK